MTYIPKKTNLPKVLLTLMLMMSAMTTTAQSSDGYAPTVQLRTNGLYDLALCPNVGLEIQTDLGLAFQVDYMGAWWNNPSRNRFFSNYAFQAELRYYFSNDDMSTAFKGWHTGAYGQMVTYDFEFGGKGYQSPNLDMSFGFGLAGGYTLPISRKWSMDFTLGLGFFQSTYYFYHPTTSAKGYLKDGMKRLRYFGPTRLEVSFVYSLNKSTGK